ncbi:MAG: DUF6265 family protein [Brevundimonas sp.]|nr:DUF6265 family protein [Brevundimonas sp.]
MLTALMMTAALVGAPQAELRPDLGWMAGYWLSCESGRQVAETWSPPRLNLMAGTSVTVRNGRVGWELSRIAPTGPEPDAAFAYFAVPEGQAPTTFPVVSSSPSRVVFEQARDDDFPKRIVYERDGDTLNARIEGVIGGEERTVEWRFRKAELNTDCPTWAGGR